MKSSAGKVILRVRTQNKEQQKIRMLNGNGEGKREAKIEKPSKENDKRRAGSEERSGGTINGWPKTSAEVAGYAYVFCNSGWGLEMWRKADGQCRLQQMTESASYGGWRTQRHD